jgi:nucleotide-binding universal stress UspA family protein
VGGRRSRGQWLSVRLVHAFGPHLPAETYAVVPPIGTATTHAVARMVLEEAMATARRTVPDLEISAHLLAGSATPALLDEVRDARLLVLGSGGRRGLSARLHGSVAGDVAVRSPCPVVVIHPVPAVVGTAAGSTSPRSEDQNAR